MLTCWRIHVGFLKIVFACLSDAQNAFFMDSPIMGSIESHVLQSVESMKVTIKEEQYVFSQPHKSNL